MTRGLLAAAVLVLLVTAGGAGADTWTSDSDIVGGLGNVGGSYGSSTPTVFQKDSTWYLIAGEYDGVFDNGYNWTGSAWQTDTAIVSGLSDVGDYATLTVFQKDSTWYLIAGESTGNFHGFNWTGSTWQTDTAIISGLGDIGGYSTPTVFQKNGVWHLISGKSTGNFHGFNWTGSTWQTDTAIISGLGDIGGYSTPTVFQKNGVWHLISGEYAGNFNGFNWTGSAWQTDTAIISGLGDVGSESFPTVFKTSEMWHLISGEFAGNFHGFNTSITLSAPINLIYTKNKFWVNHTWDEGIGDYITDSYNVSINETWHNTTTNTYYNNTLTTYGDWSNITVYAYNNTYGLSDGSVSEDVQLPLLIPAVPNGTGSTWDYYWVNHTWTEGESYGIWCGDTDSYNVSINETWHNGTTNTYYNNTGLPPHGWSNASIYAFNNTAGINETYIYQNIQLENRGITITNTSGWSGDEGENVYVDYDATDADSDTPTFSCNRTNLFADFSTANGKGNWTPTYTDSGVYHVDFGVSDGYGSTDNYTMTITVVSVENDASDPTNLQNTTGNFWVNHTWTAGSGNVTDSYNVSVNSVWHNTSPAYYNDTYTAHAWQNITVFAYNTSGTGTLSLGSISQNTQIPNNAITITNTSNWNDWAGENVYVDYDASDADSDTPTFSCNRTDLFADFSTANGKGNWTAIGGTYYIDFGVADGYGSTSNYTMTIIARAHPTNLQSTTGNFWVNHTWDKGDTFTDSFNVSINETWYNGTTNTYYNDTYTAHAWQNITVFAYNNTAGIDETYISQNTQIPNNAITITNTSDWSGDAADNVYVDYDAPDPDGDTPTFSCNRLDLFTDFDTANGTGNYTALGGALVDFGVSDGYGSTSNYTMTIAVVDNASYLKYTEDFNNYTCGGDDTAFLTGQGTWLSDPAQSTADHKLVCSNPALFDGNAAGRTRWFLGTPTPRAMDTYVIRQGDGLLYVSFYAIVNDAYPDYTDRYARLAVGNHISGSGNAICIELHGDMHATRNTIISIRNGLEGGRVYTDPTFRYTGAGWMYVEMVYDVDSHTIDALTYLEWNGAAWVPVMTEYDIGLSSGMPTTFDSVWIQCFYQNSATSGTSAYIDSISIERPDAIRFDTYLILRDMSDNPIKNSMVSVYDIGRNVYDHKWEANNTGEIIINDTEDSLKRVAVRTFDGTFVRDITTNISMQVINWTIPLNYNLKVYPEDQNGVPLTGVFAGLAEYTPLDPLSFWGFSMSGSQHVPVTNCSGFSMCDLIAEKGGYETYEETALNWTSKSALIKDYRHTATLTKE